MTSIAGAGWLTSATSSLALAVLITGVSPAIGDSRCPTDRQATVRTRTAAWVNSTCRVEGGALVGHQEIYVQRGNRQPVMLSQLQIGPIPDPEGLCRLFGDVHIGTVSILAGYFTQLAVSPDGRRVVFEVNDSFSMFDPSRPRLTDEQRGLYLANADGSGLVKLMPATSVPVYRSYNIPGIGAGSDYDEFRIAFSPDGRHVVYSDLGAASDGSLDAQLWSLRLADRAKTQLTHLSHSSGTELLYYIFAFADEDTIGFTTYDYAEGAIPPRQRFYSVSVGGSQFRELSPIDLPGGQVIPQFGIAGRRPVAQTLFIDGAPENPIFDLHKRRELFVAFRGNVVQLTAFNRSESGVGRSVISRDGRRIFFLASADPLGCNPTHNCQVFSIDVLGGGLRQHTRLSVDGDSEVGCLVGTTYPGCYIRLLGQDRATGALLFSSPCDPLGTNQSGSQLFAIRPDGSGLRQITHARGVIVDTPDVVEVELPGPMAYQ